VTIDVELSVTVSRDLLGLPPLEIATSPDYYLGSQFLGAAVQWDRQQVTSRWMDGSTTVSRHRQMVTEPIAVEITGPDLLEVQRLTNQLIAAFLQNSFVLTVVAAGSTRRYQCEAADYQNLGWTTPRLAAAQSQVLLQVPRQPVPLVGESRWSYDQVLHVAPASVAIPVLETEFDAVPDPEPEPEAEPEPTEPPDPEEPPLPTTFIVGVTKPKLVDPLNPTVSDNAGWNGDFSGGVIGSIDQPAGLYMVQAGETVQNMIFWCDVKTAGPTAKMRNCIVFGGRANPFSRFGLVDCSNGGDIERVTVYGMAHSVDYFRVAFYHRGGVLRLHRNAWFRVVDGINSDGTTNQVIATGNVGRQFAFFNTDKDHKNDGLRPWWTHNDWSQIKGGSMAIEHIIDGNAIDAFCDSTGVTWTGGSPGSGIARITGANSVGRPDVALNEGYWDAQGRVTWCNVVSFTNKPSKSKVQRNWVNGGNSPSGIFMWTPDTAGSEFVLKENRVRLGGKPSSSGTVYVVQWPSNSKRTIGTGASANKFDTTSDVPLALRGADVPFTSTGAKVNMNAYS
jgi:hypothetical protein